MSIATGKVERVLAESADPIRAVAFLPDGKRIAWGGPSGVRIFDFRTGRKLAQFSVGRGGVLGLAFRPDGRGIAAVTLLGEVTLWNMNASPQRLQSRSAVPGAGSVVFHPDGYLFAVLGRSKSKGNTVQFLDAETGRLLREIVCSSSVASGIRFSPDGKLMALGLTDGRILFWDVASGKQIRSIQAHQGKVRAIAFGPKGKRLVSGGADRLVKEWDAATGRLRTVHRGHAAGVFAVAVSPRGTRVASASGNITVLVHGSRQKQKDLLKIAEDLLAIQELKKARSILEDALRLNPGNVGARELLDRCVALQRSDDESRKLFENAQSTLNRKAFREALESITKAIVLVPNRADYFIFRGRVYTELGSIDMAIRDLSFAIRLDPMRAEAYHRRGDARAMLKDVGPALLDWRKAIELDPQRADSLRAKIKKLGGR